MPITPEEQEGMIDKIMELFQSNEAAIDYGQDPNSWVEENLPDGAEASDVASCMPQVTEQMGGPYQANAARYNASHGAQAQAATNTVVNEISYSYNTVYQQNAFIYAEEGAQVTNIQGSGNIVDQTQIDEEFNAEHPPEYDDYDPEYEEEYDGEEGEEGKDYEEGEDYEDDDYKEEGEEGEEGEEMEDGMKDGTEEPPMEEPSMEGDAQGWEPEQPAIEEVPHEQGGPGGLEEGPPDTMGGEEGVM